MIPERTAILAGDGTLPVELSLRLQEKNMLFLLIIMQGNRERFNLINCEIKEIAPGRVGKIFSLLKEYKISKCILLGKIDKNGFIERKGFDLKAIKLLKKLKNGNDTNIFKIIEAEFKSKEIEILPQHLFLKDFIAAKGLLTKRKPLINECDDIIFGMPIAKKMASMDIGQTVIVKNQTILAVEASEGTNETIIRGGNIGRKNCVICKAARKNQDMRFDIPCIGMETLTKMKESGCSTLAVEAGKMFMADRDDIISFADKNKISIIGI